MQLKKIMTPEVERIHKDASVHEVVQNMRTLDVGMIPVYDGDCLMGIVTHIAMESEYDHDSIERD